MSVVTVQVIFIIIIIIIIIIFNSTSVVITVSNTSRLAYGRFPPLRPAPTRAARTRAGRLLEGFGVLLTLCFFHLRWGLLTQQEFTRSRIPGSRSSSSGSIHLRWVLLTQQEFTRSARLAHGRFSNEDPAKSGLESERILNVEGVFSWRTV